MAERTIEEIAAKMDALGVWERAVRYTWAIRPVGTPFPYFCTPLFDDHPPVKVRFLMLEGWQTLHDFVRTRVDNSYGYYLSPMEMPHFELVVLRDGSSRLFRHDPCYLPRPAAEAERALCLKILWESYGVLLRLESDAELPLRFAEREAMFARVEGKGGRWEDGALAISRPPPFVERVMLSKADLAKAKDLPFAAEEKLEVSFSMVLGISTDDARPRCIYRLAAVDGTSGERVVADSMSATPDGGLKAMWESIPGLLLRRIVERGRVPGELMVSSPRLFRLLRPLGLDLPFRLSLHDRLPHLPA